MLLLHPLTTLVLLLHPCAAQRPCAAFFCRWGNPEFGAYVQQLQQQADEALTQSPTQMDAARAIVQQIVQLELNFWDMAYAGAA